MNSFLKLKDLQIIFPLHPRTRKKLIQFNLLSKLNDAIHIKLTSPLGYFDFMNLLIHSKIVMTDSGGIQEEAFTYGKPCITLRNNTERPETVLAGGNFLVGNNEERIEQQVKTILQDNDFEDRIKNMKNPFGDGSAGERIASICVEKCEKKLSITSPNYMKGGSALYRIVEISERFQNITVAKFEKMFHEIQISLIYDDKGVPHLPKPKIIMKKGWKIRIFGDAHLLNTFEN
jgi:UDP-N-acetylglucosamine 2-epimerase (non-hydrolysing)